MIRLEMKNYNTISTEKEQNIAALSSGKIDKDEYVSGEEIVPPDQSRVIVFTYCPLGKVFEKR